MKINTIWIHGKNLILLIVRNKVGTDYNDVIGILYNVCLEYRKSQKILQHLSKRSEEIYLSFFM